MKGYCIVRMNEGALHGADCPGMQSSFVFKNLAKFKNVEALHLVIEFIRLMALFWRRIPNDWILLHEEGASECPGMGTVIK